MSDVRGHSKLAGTEHLVPNRAFRRERFRNDDGGVKAQPFRRGHARRIVRYAEEDQIVRQPLRFCPILQPVPQRIGYRFVWSNVSNKGYVELRESSNRCFG